MRIGNIWIAATVVGYGGRSTRVQRVGQTRKSEPVERIGEAELRIDDLCASARLDGGVVPRECDQCLAEKGRRKSVRPVGHAAVIHAGMNRDVSQAVQRGGRLPV